VRASASGKTGRLTGGPLDGLDRARELQRNAGTIEVAVEAHRDITQQQPAPRSQPDTGVVDLYEPIVDQRAQTRERLAEILAEIDGVAPLERGHRNLGLASCYTRRCGA
jgi:hypothetical protein